MKVIGVECGVGSMLIPCKELGFNVVANIEARSGFNTGTFQENFDAPFYKDISRLKNKSNIDILFSHPKCSEFSTLNSSDNKGKNLHDGFWSLVQSINIIKPNFFLIDNLPKSLEFYPLTWWSDQLQDYDVTVELVSNFNYGNVQKNRKRLFIIGSLKKFKFVFIPNEKPNNLKIRNVLQETAITFNNEHFPDNMKAPGFSPNSVSSVRSLLRGYKGNGSVFYRKIGNKMIYSGTKKVGYKQRIGTMILDTNSTCATITSNLGFYLKDRLRPLTCRERAQIQGCPDWFKFVLDNKQKFSQTMGDQTGKFIPVQFVRYFTTFLNNFLNGSITNDDQVSRTLTDKNVLLNKMENCNKHGHSNIKDLCKNCDFHQCLIKQRS